MAIRERKTYECDECGYSSSNRNAANGHSCDIQRNHGMCEDFPCCGHRQGECQDRAEFHSEHWSEMHERLGDEGYELYCEIMDRQEMGY